MSKFNTLLHRTIQTGEQYNHLLPNATFKQQVLNNGDTFYSVSAMKNLVTSQYAQCNKIAPILAGDTLKQTTTNIYNFLYNHIQYKQDNALQQLRTPANSWQNRAVGIDCKSYSIFASCILSCLNIKHYIRQIKQPGYNPNKYTHVYIIAPIDQQTANIQDGYYVIDATVKRNNEPVFIKKHDTLMDKLPHVGLYGAKPTKRKTTAKRKPVATKKKPVATKKKTIKKLTATDKTLLGLGAVLGITQLL